MELITIEQIETQIKEADEDIARRMKIRDGLVELLGYKKGIDKGCQIIEKTFK